MKYVTFATVIILTGCSWFESAPPAPVPPASSVQTESNKTPGSTTSFVNDMKNVQQKLADAGFYHRDIDGVWGPATQAALRSYQRANSLAVTGELDTATKTMMYPDTH